MRQEERGHKSISHETVVVVVRQNNKVVLDYVCVGIVTVSDCLFSCVCVCVCLQGVNTNDNN